jgi:mono/diheme cytochrome c family protein
VKYPFWELSTGYGILMAAVALIHVSISHFAIGGGLYLVVSEWRARKLGDSLRLQFLRRLSRFFVLVTLVGGALTGVGIWFVIGLLNPAATEVLIHNFVWAWATEWTFFIVEILAALLYYYGWDRMSARDHMVLGWIYFGAAWLSLFVINGIITFMLTPGRWLVTGAIRDGFFNPSFWPSLALRTAITVCLAGLYGLLIASRTSPPDFKTRIVRETALWGLAGLAAAVPAVYWYVAALPPALKTAVNAAMPVPLRALQMSWYFAAAAGALLLVFGLVLPRRQHLVVAVATLAAGLGWFSCLEWTREAARKPYIITGYMYGNGLEVAKLDEYRKSGLLPSVAYRSGDDGADLFRRACRSCHTVSGYNPLQPAFEGTDRAFIAAIVKSAHLLKGNMPPFVGTPAEADAIAGYLSARIDVRSMGAVSGLQGADLGRKIFAVRCAKCHTTGTAKPVDASVTGLSDDDYRNMLDSAADLGEGMPAFTAGPDDSAALIAYFKTLGAAAK